MIRSAIMFLVIALIAGITGFGFIAGSAAIVAQTVFYISTVMLLVSFLSVPPQQQTTGSLDT